jgi:hypothetical protein
MDVTEVTPLICVEQPADDESSLPEAASRSPPAAPVVKRRLRLSARCHWLRVTLYALLIALAVICIPWVAFSLGRSLFYFVQTLIAGSFPFTVAVHGLSHHGTIAPIGTELTISFSYAGAPPPPTHYRLFSLSVLEPGAHTPRVLSHWSPEPTFTWAPASTGAYVLTAKTVTWRRYTPGDRVFPIPEDSDPMPTTYTYSFTIDPLANETFDRTCRGITASDAMAGLSAAPVTGDVAAVSLSWSPMTVLYAVPFDPAFAAAPHQFRVYYRPKPSAVESKSPRDASRTIGWSVTAWFPAVRTGDDQHSHAYVVGLLPSTHYEMYHEVRPIGTTPAADTADPFPLCATTDVITQAAPFRLPATARATPALLDAPATDRTHEATAPLILHAAARHAALGSSHGAYATDLDGNLLWMAPHPLSRDDNRAATSALFGPVAPGLFVGAAAGPNLNPNVSLDSSAQALVLIDVAGSIVARTTTHHLSHSLAAASGPHVTMFKDAVALPDGRIAALVSAEYPAEPYNPAPTFPARERSSWSMFWHRLWNLFFANSSLTSCDEADVDPLGSAAGSCTTALGEVVLVLDGSDLGLLDGGVLQLLPALETYEDNMYLFNRGKRVVSREDGTSYISPMASFAVARDDVADLSGPLLDETRAIVAVGAASLSVLPAGPNDELHLIAMPLRGLDDVIVVGIPATGHLHAERLAATTLHTPRIMWSLKADLAHETDLVPAELDGGFFSRPTAAALFRVHRAGAAQADLNRFYLAVHDAGTVRRTRGYQAAHRGDIDSTVESRLRLFSVIPPVPQLGFAGSLSLVLSADLGAYSPEFASIQALDSQSLWVGLGAADAKTVDSGLNHASASSLEFALIHADETLGPRAESIFGASSASLCRRVLRLGSMYGDDEAVTVLAALED